MRNVLTSLLTLGILACAAAPPNPAGMPAASAPVLAELTSNKGREMLGSISERADFVALSSAFTTQETLTYCGVATATMILNALDLERPESESHRPYRYFTQGNVFAQTSLPRELVDREGMTLQQFGGLLRDAGAVVVVHHAQDVSLERFRQDLLDALARPDAYLAVNYLRSAIGQETGGHISPVAAYHSGSDCALILDVARYKYPPVWVKVAALYHAMNTMDSASNHSRGYAVVSRK